MIRTMRSCLLSVACLGAVLICTTVTSAQQPLADDIIRMYEEVKMPAYDRARADEEGYREEYMKARADAEMAKAEIIGDLYQKFPTDPRVPDLMTTRWMILSRSMSAEASLNDAKLVLADKPGEPLAGHAHHAIAQNRLTMCYEIESDVERADAAIEAAMTFAKAYPKDDRGARLLYTAARSHITDPDEQRAAYQLVVANYPDSSTAPRVKGKLRQIDGLGEPFELDFTDAVTGTEIDMAHLRGKVVVIDFWATWCGPCIAEMPHMKELYAEFKEAGVEFIGISLDSPEDQGGLDKLLKYCEENEITWPQYYQGKGWNGDFSKSWGIDSIPSMFVVAKDGTLASVSARGKLEEIIPAELKK